MKKNSKLVRNIFYELCGLACIVLSIVFHVLAYQDIIVYTLDVLGLIFCLLPFIFQFQKTETKKRSMNVIDITIVASMGAIATILYIFVKFPLPIFPTFLDLQISELPALITGFAYGPVSGMFVILIKFIIKLPLSSTAMVGEIGDLILGLSVVLTSSLIYRKWHTFKGAIFSLISSVIVGTLMACLINYSILIPFYLEFYFNGDINGLISMCSMIPGINQDNFMTLYLLGGIVPFNLIRFVITDVLTILVYKSLHNFFEKLATKSIKMKNHKSRCKEVENESSKSISKS